MTNSSGDHMEAAPQERDDIPSTISNCKPKAAKRTAIIISLTLVVTAIAAGVVLSSKSKNDVPSTSSNFNAQDANGLNSDAYPIALFSRSSDRNIPQGYKVCETEEACNARRQELGIERFVVSSSAGSKGCFSVRKTAYFGRGGTPSSMSQTDLPGRRQRIWCVETEESFATLSVGEKVATYLAPFKRVKENGPNIELNDGTFYELINLPADFDDSEWITGVTTVAIPTEAEFNADGTVDMKGMSPSFVADLDTRSNSRFRGSKTVLAIRVEAAGNMTTGLDEYSLSDGIFGTGVDTVNLASQFQDCSYGKLKFVTAPDRSGKSSSSGNVEIANGVATVRLPSVSVSQGTAVMRNAISKELNTIFGTKNPNELADYVIYCLPPGTFATGTYSEVGYAYYNSWLSVLNNQWCASVSLQMHEVGHSLNFAHSNEDGVTYEDGSGIMGASYKSSDRPRMCFNAAKSWQAGWYQDKEVIVGGLLGVTCFNGTLHGISDYPKATTVLLKLVGKQTDMFINFNAKRGINQGTQEGGDQVMAVTRIRGERDSFAVSNLQAKLSAGDVFTFEKYKISVETIDTVEGVAGVTVLSNGRNVCAGN